jgi:hypothetical protein
MASTSSAGKFSVATNTSYTCKEKTHHLEIFFFPQQNTAAKHSEFQRDRLNRCPWSINVY